MPQVINTNIASLNAQRNLNSSQASLRTSLERLSSGLRINSAKDDAAGLAISSRFTAQIRGQEQAVRNANDGISFAQTAEGALGTIGEALQRIRQLAVQSANDTNSATDRQALNDEVKQLVAEVNRVSNSTQFNGQNILDGNLSELVFQVGANKGQTISVTGVDARASQLGAEVATGTSVTLSDITGVNNGTAIAAGDFTDVSVNGVSIDLSAADSIEDVVSAINTKYGDTGVQAVRASSVEVDNLAFTALTTGQSGTLTINGVDISLAEGDTYTDAIDKINDASAQTGVSAEAGTNANTIKITSNQDVEVEMTGNGAFGGLATTEQESYVRGIELMTDVGGTITTGGTDVTTLGFTAAQQTTTTYTAAALDVSTRDDASDALRTVDLALQQVSSMRAELGAVQTRFESTISNLSTSSENLSAARSRILDADFAAETANLTRSQILQQAGTAMLAQANSLPQGVLSLLG